MAREALKRDLKNGIVTDLLVDDDFDGFVVSSTQDIEELKRRNHGLEELHSEPGREMRLAASIPLVIWNKLVHEGIANDPDRLKAWLNDPDNRVFRVWKGRM